MADDIRVAYAWLTAPPTTVLVAALATSFLVLADYHPILSVEWVVALVAIGVLFLVFGAPLAFAVQVLVGLPAYCLLRAGKHVRPLTAVCVAAMVAAAAFTGVIAAVFATSGRCACGALSGAAGALVGTVVWVGFVRRVPDCRMSG